jgi:O-ureido-D-serine cyclo-ligase
MNEPNPSIALVSARVARDLDEDQSPLERALREAGARVTVADWDDPAVDWGAFDLAVLRSTWDYTTRLSDFLVWASEVSTRTRLINPLPVVRWNVDKHYLSDLDRAGIPTIPSRFIEPGEDAGVQARRWLSEFETDEVVVKPAVGAGSKDAQRHDRTNLAAIRQHAHRLLDERRSVLIQPYLKSVDQRGETALLFYAGEYSHAICKGPLLKRSDESIGGLFAPETITPRAPTAQELDTAKRVVAAIPFETPPYARVDLIQDDHGVPRVLELELTEPSMFFAHAPGAAARFAKVLLQALRQVCFAQRANNPAD